MRKLPARSQMILTPLILSGLMSFVVSAIATVKAVGMEPMVLDRIFQAWSVSFPVAFPTAVLVMPLVRRFVGLVVETR